MDTNGDKLQNGTNMVENGDLKRKENETKEVEDTLYGWGTFKPRWIQWMNNLPCFTAWSVLYIIAWGTCNIGPAIPHLEKQFGLSSTRTAIMTSCLDIAGLSIMLFVSYIGTRFNKAKGVAIGAFVCAVGAFIETIPRWIADAPRFAMTYTATSVGGGLGSVVGGWIQQNVYVDVDRVDPSEIPKGPRDPNWIGAWWLIFLATGAISFISSIPLYGYPKYLPEGEEDVGLRHILTFATGADQMPALGFHPQPKLVFHAAGETEEDSSNFPYANTCSNVLSLPLIKDYVTFKRNVLAAIAINFFSSE